MSAPYQKSPLGGDASHSPRILRAVMSSAPAPSATTVARLLVGLVLVGAGVLLYRAFLVLPQFRVFALTLVSLVLEALPYLLLGSLAAALVGTILPAGRLAALAPRLGLFGIPLAALAGIAAPVCECAIVPTVARLREKGLSLPYAVTILVAVPLINPVVLLSTMAAFRGRPALVIARFVGGYLVAIIVGLVFWLVERAEQRAVPHGAGAAPAGGSRARTPAPAAKLVIAEAAVTHPRAKLAEPDAAPSATARAPFGARALEVAHGTLEEFLEVARFFVVGALLASLVQAVVPAAWFAGLAGSLLAATLVMIALAWLLSVCSEADAFIGKAFLPLMPAPAIIAFLVFGPMLDLKNTVMLAHVLPARSIALLTLVLLVSVTALALVLGVIW